MREEILRVRLNDGEKAKIAENASKGYPSVSDFVRSRCLPEASSLDPDIKAKASLAISILQGTIDSKNIMYSTMEILEIPVSEKGTKNFDSKLKQRAISILAQIFI